MKPIHRLLATALAVAGTISGCNYLDVTPTEITTEKDTYASYNSGVKYLYSSYAFLPNPAVTQWSLDFFTGDEIVTSFEHETFAAFPKGNYSASNTVISYWDSFFNGLRQCYEFEEVIDKFPDTSEEVRADYRAQVKFLLAYYHYLMLRCYGPIILVTEKPNINAKISDYPARVPLDECVQWISDRFDEAANALPARRQEQSRHGLATSVAAKAFKAKLWLYAASPLFNSDRYKDMQDNNGLRLMPQAYDPQKWVKARTSLKEAIDAAEAAGYALYTKDDFEMSANDNQFPSRGIVRRLRTAQLDWKGAPNPEVIFSDSRGTGFYGTHAKSAPVGRTPSSGYNGVSPTWAMLNRFYTKNGLPWDEDPEFASMRTDAGKTTIVEIPQDHAEYGRVGERTIAFNLNREPRFYAWVGFHGGWYEILNKDNNNKAYPENYMPETGRVLLDFLRNGRQGAGSRTNNYSPGGYLNKKFCTPNHRLSNKDSGQETLDFPHPLVRLADLYLAYAEACVETGDLTTAKTYLNRVRERAGIPTVETSWQGVAELTQDKLRQIVRQERMVELYLENQNFWDMRRWLLAKEAFGKKAQGLNIQGESIEEFARVVDIAFERNFLDAHYLLPLPIDDINRNLNLVNNPGY